MLCQVAQCVLNGSQVYWTMEVEDAFETESMKECVESLEQQVPAGGSVGIGCESSWASCAVA